MIKVQSNTPLIWQHDNSYYLPTVTGAVQWNGVAKCFEVSNGSGWVEVSNTVTLNTDPRWEKVIHWAVKKMLEEEELTRLSAEHPTLATLIAQKHDVEQQIDLIKTLIKEEVKV